MRHCRSGGMSFEDVHAAGRAEADDVREPDSCTLDLARTRLTAQVVADLPDVGDPGG